MCAMPAIDLSGASLPPETYLHAVERRFPALGPVVDAVRGNWRLMAVIADVVMHLPHFPVTDRAAAAAALEENSREVIETELGWLAREMGWLRSEFESAVFRRLPGAGRREERDEARFYLAVIARLFRLERADACLA